MELAGYQIDAPIGDGGMATVYKGLQLSLQRPVAIKVLKQSMRNHDEIRARFEREAMIIARLNHPNIVHVIDQGVTSDGEPYFIMEYVKSVSLAAAMKRGGISDERALNIFMQIAKALSYAHRNGVVHCDIKPENVLVDFEGVVRVLDFGISQLYEEGVEEKTDYVMGSNAYMAPEQHRSIHHATEKSDIYSLGVIMYLYFGKYLPGHDVVPLHKLNTKISRSLSDLVQSCLSTQPEDRPDSAETLKNQLLLLLKGRHLDVGQKERANSGLKKSFQLLDVIKEDDHGAVYLYKEQTHQNLFVIKKRSIKHSGLKTAQKLAEIDHQSLIKILGTSKNDRVYILVMEYCRGGSLADRLIVPYEISEFYNVALSISLGIAAAHNEGLLHGNLRPTNVLFNEHEQAKIADFGLDEHYLEPSNEKNWYCLAGQGKSRAADIYAVGVMFYQMLAGERPKFKKEQLISKKAFEKLPFSLKKLIEGMLKRDPKVRLQNFEFVSRQIEELMSDDPTMVRPGTIEKQEIDDLPLKPAGSKRGKLALLFLILLGVILMQLYYFNPDIFAAVFISVNRP